MVSVYDCLPLFAYISDLLYAKSGKKIEVD